MTVLEQTEGRPRHLTEAMKIAAAKELVRELVNCNHLSANEADDAAKDIARCAHGPWTDGYSIAKWLDDHHGWDCNFGIAEILDGWSTVAGDALSTAEKEWAERVKPQPPFPNGTHVRISEKETGVIDGIYEYGPAKYLIKIDGDPQANTKSKSRRIVNFEDVALLTRNKP